MAEYEKTLDFALSEAKRFVSEVNTVNLKENVHYLRMALRLLDEEIDEKSKTGRSCDGLGEIPKVQVEISYTVNPQKDQKRAPSNARRCTQ